MTPDLYWIHGPWLGRLAITARPRGADWLDEEFEALRSSGIDVLVSLLEPAEAAELGLAMEAVAAQSAHLRFVNFPIPDRSIPAHLMETQQMLKDLRTELNSGHNVAIHCRQSVGRSGLIAAALLISEGIDDQKAVQDVTRARGLEVPETPAQLSWLAALPQHHLAELG
jgi:protein-tyrosine phosphatase